MRAHPVATVTVTVKPEEQGCKLQPTCCYLLSSLHNSLRFLPLQGVKLTQHVCDCQLHAP